MGTLANSADTDEMQHNASFHHGLRCLLGFKHYPDWYNPKKVVAR